MENRRISGRADLAAIEARPYRDYIDFDHVGDALSAACSRHADRPALVYIENPDPTLPARRWTHAEFLDAVRRAANLFSRLAGGEPPRVAMLLPPIPQAYFTLWGAESVGTICPINNLLDARHIAELINAAQASILVALGPHPELDIWSRVEELRRACPGLRHVLAVGGAPGAEDFDARLAESPAEPPPRRPEGSVVAPAALFHTGGTTGAPKLAQHLHPNQIHSGWGAAQMYAMDERDVIINGFPLFHVAGSIVYGLSSLLSGACIVLPTMLGMRNTAFVRRYWDFVELHRATFLAAVPTVMAALLNLESGDTRRDRVRALLTGGSPLPTELAVQFEHRFGIPVRNILGMTECAGVISIEPVLAPRVPGSCGWPLPFTEVVAVHDDGQASRCAAGETGILRVRGPNVSPGYTDARRNSGTFDGDGWLVTGDIGHVDGDGRVFVTGRAKDVIIRGGHNIDPGLIEEALLAHPEVQMAAAVGEPDEYAGELPIAYVMFKPKASVELDALAEFARARIPERPAYPKRLERVDAIPVTAIGKVYKPALRLRAIEHVVADRLSRAGISHGGIDGVDDSGRLSVVIHAAPGTTLDRAGVERLLSRFAFGYRIAAGSDQP